MASAAASPPASDPPPSLWATYCRLLDERPYTTRAATAACLSALSELTAATLTGRKRSPKRAALMFLWGACWSGPAGHAWQRLLDRAGVRSPAARTLADNTLYGPLTNALALAYIAAIVDRKRGVASHVAATLPAAQKKAWRVWPVASIAAYCAVPPRMRTPFFNCVAYVWGVALILGSK